MSENESPGDADARDLALMAQVATGDAEAFRELVETHQARVIGTVARMLGPSADIEDVAQSVFIRVWKAAPRYKASAKFTTWLMTITRNLVFNEVRRRGRAAWVSLEAASGDEGGRFAGERTGQPDAKAESKELQDAIDGAIAALPEQQRLAVILRRYEGMPYEEIAEVLGTSVSAVKSLLFRARADLKERLQSFL